MRLSKPSDECRLTALSNPSMYPATAFAAWWLDCHATGQFGSDLMVPKNGSIIALS